MTVRTVSTTRNSGSRLAQAVGRWLSRSEVAAAIARRRRQAVDMRLAGVDNLTIGLALSAFPEHHAAGTEPPEYGYGWFNRARGGPVLSERALLDAVSKDVQRSLTDSRDALAASADRHRELHLARLERLLAGSWARAVRGDHQAVASCLRILDREARLLRLPAST